jgi:hypothetical protein
MGTAPSEAGGHRDHPWSSCATVPQGEPGWGATSAAPHRSSSGQSERRCTEQRLSSCLVAVILRRLAAS